MNVYEATPLRRRLRNSTDESCKLSLSLSRRFELVRYFVYSDPEKVRWMKAREKEDSRQLTGHEIKRTSYERREDEPRYRGNSPVPKASEIR